MVSSVWKCQKHARIWSGRKLLIPLMCYACAEDQARLVTERNSIRGLLFSPFPLFVQRLLHLSLQSALVTTRRHDDHDDHDENNRNNKTYNWTWSGKREREEGWGQRETTRGTDRYTDRYTDRRGQTDTNRHRDRQIHRQRQRQDRECDRDRETNTIK